MKIISDRDKEGNFIDAAEAWTPEKIEELLKKYNPSGKLWYSSKNQGENKEAKEENN